MGIKAFPELLASELFDHLLITYVPLGVCLEICWESYFEPLYSKYIGGYKESRMSFREDGFPPIIRACTFAVY